MKPLPSPAALCPLFALCLTITIIPKVGLALGLVVQTHVPHFSVPGCDAQLRHGPQLPANADPGGGSEGQAVGFLPPTKETRIESLAPSFVPLNPQLLWLFGDSTTDGSAFAPPSLSLRLLVEMSGVLVFIQERIEA